MRPDARLLRGQAFTIVAEHADRRLAAYRSGFTASSPERPVSSPARPRWLAWSSSLGVCRARRPPSPGISSSPSSRLAAAARPGAAAGRYATLTSQLGAVFRASRSPSCCPHDLRAAARGHRDTAGTPRRGPRWPPPCPTRAARRASGAEVHVLPVSQPSDSGRIGPEGALRRAISRLTSPPPRRRQEGRPDTIIAVMYAGREDWPRRRMHSVCVPSPALAGNQAGGAEFRLGRGPGGALVDCPRQPPCPPVGAPDREAAHVVAAHPEQGSSLLCNGVVVFEDTSELLPDSRIIAPHRGRVRSRPRSFLRYPLQASRFRADNSGPPMRGCRCRRTSAEAVQDSWSGLIAAFHVASPRPSPGAGQAMGQRPGEGADRLVVADGPANGSPPAIADGRRNPRAALNAARPAGPDRRVGSERFGGRTRSRSRAWLHSACL